MACFRTIDDGTAAVHVAGDLLLATGAGFGPGTGKGGRIGLAAYGLDGRKRLQLFDGRGVWGGTSTAAAPTSTSP